MNEPKLKPGDWVTMQDRERGTHDNGATYEIKEIVGNTVYLRRMEWSRFRELLHEFEHDTNGYPLKGEIQRVVNKYYGDDKSCYYDLKEEIPAYPIKHLVLYQTREQREKWGKK